MSDYSAYLPLAHRLADAAGEVLRGYYRQPLPVDWKADDSPVTKADREAEDAMRALIKATHPDHSIYGEEGDKCDLNAEWIWTLDPIDGTRSFIAGKPQFTTLISLCHKGVPVLGIIDQCITRERWVGVQGQPTTLNDEPVQVRDCTSLADALVATTSPEYFTAEQHKRFLDIRLRCRDVTYGGDGYNYALLASGHVDLVVEAGLKPYDFCALLPVVDGAGGAACDWENNALNIHSDGCVFFASKTALLNEIK